MHFCENQFLATICICVFVRQRPAAGPRGGAAAAAEGGDPADGEPAAGLDEATVRALKGLEHKTKPAPEAVSWLAEQAER